MYRNKHYMNLPLLVDSDNIFLMLLWKKVISANIKNVFNYIIYVDYMNTQFFGDLINIYTQIQNRTKQ